MGHSVFHPWAVEMNLESFEEGGGEGVGPLPLPQTKRGLIIQGLKDRQHFKEKAVVFLPGASERKRLRVTCHSPPPGLSIGATPPHRGAGRCVQNTTTRWNCGSEFIRKTRKLQGSRRANLPRFGSLARGFAEELFFKPRAGVTQARLRRERASRGNRTCKRPEVGRG